MFHLRAAASCLYILRSRSVTFHNDEISVIYLSSVLRASGVLDLSRTTNGDSFRGAVFSLYYNYKGQIVGCYKTIIILTGIKFPSLI